MVLLAGKLFAQFTFICWFFILTARAFNSASTRSWCKTLHLLSLSLASNEKLCFFLFRRARLGQIRFRKVELKFGGFGWDFWRLGYLKWQLGCLHWMDILSAQRFAVKIDFRCLSQHTLQQIFFVNPWVFTQHLLNSLKTRLKLY